MKSPAMTEHQLQLQVTGCRASRGGCWTSNLYLPQKQDPECPSMGAPSGIGRKGGATKSRLGGIGSTKGASSSLNPAMGVFATRLSSESLPDDMASRSDFFELSRAFITVPLLL